MKRNGFVASLVAAVAVGWAGGSVFSEDKPGEGDPSKDEWIKFGQPGEEHARLKPLVGEWAVHGKMTGPDGKVTESDSTSSISMFLGDRFLLQEVNGKFEGMDFQGRGLIGYDKGRKKWVGAWVDNFGTGIMTSEGVENEKGKCWTFEGSFQGPQGPIAMKDVLKVLGPNELSWVSHMGGSPEPMMTLTYKRK
jgi:hypothetical protein